VLHVGDAIDVVEELGTGRFQPLREPLGTDGGAGTAARWLRAAGIGIVHVHGVDEGCRARLAALRRALPLPYVVTLHDLLFVNPRAFDLSGVPDADEDWIALVRPVLLQADTVIAPSAFIGDLALRLAPGIRTQLIAPGIRAERPARVEPPARDFAAQAPRHVVAIAGAIGPHKGSGLVDPLAAALQGSDIGIVVIGYTDKALSARLARPGSPLRARPYVDSRSGWLATGAELVLFPNRLPESAVATLSEVWATDCRSSFPTRARSASASRVTAAAGASADSAVPTPPRSCGACSAEGGPSASA
jgi:glycosyltransferase involved in cell wall biosynthesis